MANATVFGEIAGETMAEEAADSPLLPYEAEALASAEAKTLDALGEGESPYPIRAELKETMWNKVGLRRNGTDIQSGIRKLLDLKKRAADARAEGSRAYNLAWQHTLDVRNQVCVAELIAYSALERDESRGSHYRDDCPETQDEDLYNVYMKREGTAAVIERKPVTFNRLNPKVEPAALGAPDPNFID